MEFTAANVERVVKEFYCAGAGAAASTYNEWLDRSRASKEAWSFAWELLSSDQTAEVQFFGANTLALKVSGSFDEIGEGDFPLLRERLVGAFRQYSDGGPKVVQVRLAVAVAALMIQSAPRLWADPVGDQMNLLRKDLDESGTKMLPGFLELLTVLPEEFSTLALSNSKKIEVRERFSKNLPEVLQLITQLLQEQSVSEETKRQAVRSLEGWVNFGIPMEASEKIIQLLLSKVTTVEESEEYLEVMTSIISQPDMHSHPNTAKRIIPQLLTLDGLLSKHFAEEDFDGAHSLASLFVAIGEHHSRLLLDWTLQSDEGRSNASKVVSIILQLSSTPAQFPTQERVSEMLFGFWYIFQDDIIACEPQEYQACVAVYGHAFHALVEAFLRKSMLPKNSSDWSAEEKEAFRCYRTDVADTIMYCHNILRDNLLKLLNHHLDEAIRLCHQNHAEHWPYLEACMHAWSALGEALAEEEENYLLIQFLSKLPSIPFNGQFDVITATLDCIGGFAEWLANYPNLVANLVPMVTSVVGDPGLSMSATMTLKDLARDCADALQPCARDIIGACVAALSSGRLKPGESARIMYPLGKMIAFLPRGDMLNELKRLLAPYMTELRAISDKGPSQAPCDQGQVVHVLKMFTTLFQALEGSEPGLPDVQVPGSPTQKGHQKEAMAILLQEVFPLVTAVSKPWISNEPVMEAVLLFMKQALVCLEGTRLLVMDTVEFLHAGFLAYPHCMVYDVYRQLLLQYGKSQQLRSVLVRLMAAITQKTLHTVRTAPVPSVHSDLVATSFQAYAQMLKRHPDYFTGPDDGGVDVRALFDCACFTLHLPESSAARYSASFLATLVAASTAHAVTNPILASVVLEGGLSLVKSAVARAASAGGASSSSSPLEFTTEILFALGKHYFEQWAKWLDVMAREEGFPSPCVTREKKEDFARRLLKEKGHKRKLQEITKDFSLTCQALQRTAKK